MVRIGLILVVVVVGVVSGCAEQAATEIRVMTYNIHHGEGMDGEIDLERIAAVIRAADPDIVALQEVDRGVKRSGGVDQPAVLAELTGMEAIFEKNIPYQGGEYGNAVLTRLPVVKYENHYLPQTRPGEQRGMLEVHVDLPVEDASMVFFATHLDYHEDDTERVQSIAMLREMLEAGDYGLVLVAGDLNAEPDSRVMEDAGEFLVDAYGDSGGDGFTYPADRPEKRIDYVLCNYPPSDHFSVKEHRVIPEAVASDHRPVMVVYEIDME